jgi:uncharacterized membrane protein YphA (DoxX/SURF4 family)
MLLCEKGYTVNIFSMLYLVARLCLALVFIASSVAKLSSLPAFIQGVRSYQLLPPVVAPGFAWLLLLLELIFGVTVGLGPMARVSALGLGLLTCMFMAAVGINLARGSQIACSCFGAGEADDKIGASTIVRQVSILLLAVFVAGAPDRWLAPATVELFSLEGATALGVAALLLLGYALAEILVKMWRSPQ